MDICTFSIIAAFEYTTGLQLGLTCILQIIIISLYTKSIETGYLKAYTSLARYDHTIVIERCMIQARTLTPSHAGYPSHECS